MIRMAFHFVVSMARHQWAKFCGYDVIAPSGVQAYRNSICGPCEFNVDEQCQACKCLIVSKTMLSMEACPKRKWGRVWFLKL